MKFTFLTPILCGSALLLSACDKKPEVTVVPPAPAPVTPPAEIFSDSGATAFLKEYKGYFNDLAEAVKTGDKTKLKPLLDKGSELMTKGKAWAEKVKPEEFKAYTEKLTEYAKPLKEAGLKFATGALDKFKASGKAGWDSLQKELTAPAAPAEAAPAAPEPAPAAN